MTQAEKEIKKLADFFLEELPNEIQEGSAVDNAIRLLSRKAEKPKD